jgi:scyllo-inositol 2-dehydrogenase (NADP+)
MKSTRIRVGIAGMGRSGEEMHAKYVGESDGFQLEAISDMTAARLAASKKRLKAKKAYASYDELLHDEAVELVVVATPSQAHCEMVLAAFERGKHVLVEKPVALSLDEFERMEESARKHGLVFACFHNRRWDGDYLRVRTIIADGLLGDVFDIQSRCIGYGPGLRTFGVQEFRPQWRAEKAYGGGQLYDWGSHLIDQVLMMVPSKVETVYGDLKSLMWSDEVDDHFKVLIKFEDGTTAEIESSADCRMPLPRWFVTGTKGALSSTWHELHVRSENVDIADEIILSSFPNEWPAFYENLAQVIRTGAELAVKPEEVKRTVAVIDAAMLSSKERRSVKPGVT